MKIKSCPFCGRRPEVQKVERLDLPGWIEFRISCDSYKCVRPAVTSHTTIDEAGRKWNKRNGKEKQ
jgi:hypothetical protein